jgi:hypothetical protein
MCADTQSLRYIRNGVTPFRDLFDRIDLKFFGKSWLAHVSLLVLIFREQGVYKSRGYSIASNKETILDSEEVETFKEKQHLYNYLVRLLMERLTHACAMKAKGEPASLHVTFSRRTGTDYQAMREYFEFMRDGKEKMKPVRSINWNVFEPSNIRVENHSIRAGLQIADVVTSATYNALEPDRYGKTEPRYSIAMKSRYLTQKKVIANHGIMLVPPPWKSPLNEAQKQYVVEMQKR